MAAKDALGNIQSAVCSVKVDFVTDDRTVGDAGRDQGGSRRAGV